MELSPLNFYKTAYLSNTLYLVQMAIEKELAQDIMRYDPTRVLYADTSIVFRERMRRLKEQGHEDIESLNLPFVSYYNPGNWVPDDRIGMLSAKGALSGFNEVDLGYQSLKFLHTRVTFTCYAYFANYLDAQLAYETILWLDKPAPLQYPVSGVQYKGYALDIPVNINVENLVMNPELQQKEFFEKRKIHVVKFDLTVRSVSFSQKPQPEGSTIFDNDGPPSITEKVLLDFMNYKFTNRYLDTQNIVLEVQRALTIPFDFTPLMSVDQITETSFRVAWYVDPDAIPNLNPTAQLSLGAVFNSSVPLSLGSYTFQNLSPESTYTATLWIYGNDGRVNNGSVTATTTSTAPLFLKAIKGY